MFESYASKPSVIQAVRFTYENKNRIYNELSGQFCADHEDGSPVLKVQTAHGDVAVVRIGDWIAKDINPGTYYPIKHEGFVAKYEPSLCGDNAITERATCE